MARIATSLVALLSLVLVVGAGAQKRANQEFGSGAEDPFAVTQDELDQIQRRRADAMRRDMEISRELERLPERHMIDRTGGPTTWRLWDTY